MAKNEIIRYPLWHYVDLFESMNCNRHHGRVAPHKAVMLLAVMKGVETGFITNGFVPINEKMKGLFETMWRKYVGVSVHFNPRFETPFFHLSNEPFWQLMKREEYVEKEEYSFPALQRNFYGAKISDDLFDHITNAASRQRLVKALTDKFLDGDNRNSYGSAASKECGIGFVAEGDVTVSKDLAA